MRADLHIHSTFSDGSHTPEEIAAIAKSRNVGLISVCDHATAAGYARLLKSCDAAGIHCVLGIELSAQWQDEDDLHLLAYNFDRGNPALKALIGRQYQDIECEYIVYNMCRDYPQMSLEEYRRFTYPKERGGWKYLHYAVAKGAAATYEAANATIYSKYATPNHLSGSGSCSLERLCATIRQAGGVPVLAHPGYLYESYGPEKFMERLADAKACGIGGIECYYPCHTKAVTALCVDFCQRNDLRITGGCDCHGDIDQSEGFSIGNLDISLEMLDLKGII